MGKATPILVGIHHLEQRETDPTIAREPIELMIDAVTAAAQDAGNKALLNASSVRVIRGIWPYQNPAKAGRRCVPKRSLYSAATLSKPQ